MTAQPFSRNVQAGWTDALGTSDAFLQFQEHVSQITDSKRPVLILGERGTGKELAAQRIHYMSRRWDRPFVTLLCTALNPNLLEAELFGYEEGAFTGARERRKGYFEYADQGTLFLDEVADMPLPLQDKLLRALEYGSLTRVGSTVSIHVDVRVVAATNRDVRGLVDQGLLRPDLLDRLACEVVHVPPLRERGEDIPLLARHFANKLAVELGSAILTRLSDGIRFGPEALRQMHSHAWPGNVRELKNAVERSLLRARGGEIERLVLDPYTPPWRRLPEKATPPQETLRLPDIEQGIPPHFKLPQALQEFEQQAVRTALRQTRYKQTEAARLLGLSYHQFRALYKKYGGRGQLTE